MPYKASRVENAYRIAPVKVLLLKEDGTGIEEVILNVKYRPLSLNKLEEWDAVEEQHKASSSGQQAADEPPDGEETDEQKAARVQAEKEEERRQRTIIARQLSDDVVLDLDLTEDDGVTPKRVTYEYLLKQDIGLLKDIKAKIEERAFPEKKEMLDLIRLRVLSSGISNGESSVTPRPT